SRSARPSSPSSSLPRCSTPTRRASLRAAAGLVRGAAETNVNVVFVAGDVLDDRVGPADGAWVLEPGGEVALRDQLLRDGVVVKELLQAGVDEDVLDGLGGDEGLEQLPSLPRVEVLGVHLAPVEVRGIWPLLDVAQVDVATGLVGAVWLEAATGAGRHVADQHGLVAFALAPRPQGGVEHGDRVGGRPALPRGVL